MTYEFFKESLLAELEGHFPPDTSISICPIPKNNEIILDGLTILESGFNIAPTIYLEEYYERLCSGTAFSEVLREILKTYETYRPMENIDSSFFADFTLVESQIVYKLVHFQRNQALLSEIPHIPYLDLAIVFYCLISSSTLGNATILIRNSHLTLWNITTQDLYLHARKNTPLLLAFNLEKMEDLMAEILPLEHRSGKEVFPMYVLTNRSGFLGAACVLYENLLYQLSQQLNTDFYIIPSSIHEVILVPASQNITKDDFNMMIDEVNCTQLSPEEILSDHVYYYSQKENKITA